jgi:hypothetical protein
MNLNIFRKGSAFSVGEFEGKPDKPYMVPGNEFAQIMFEELDLGFISLSQYKSSPSEIEVTVDEKRHTLMYKSEKNTVIIKFEVDPSTSEITGISYLNTEDERQLSLTNSEDNFVIINKDYWQILFDPRDKDINAQGVCSLPALLDRILYLIS